ncbi:hypothetical protein ACMA5I_06665 [Paracoccaceae bacterium GXU_MW_L88]
MSRFEVRFNGVNWDVFDLKADKIVGTRENLFYADNLCDRMERKAKQKHRFCMVCHDRFLSEGAHNRMCIKCRRLSYYDGAA